MTSPSQLLQFWSDAGEERWFRSDAAFDQTCRQTWLASWQDAAAGRLAAWEHSPEGALALVLLLDQIPRNVFRGTAQVYATDAEARRVATYALDRGYDRQVPDRMVRFFHLPFMHSEALSDQDRSVALAEASGQADALKWARHHRDIVARFGRFPHRNAVLGRTSTPQELAWLADEGAFKG